MQDWSTFIFMDTRICTGCAKKRLLNIHIKSEGINILSQRCIARAYSLLVHALHTDTYSHRVTI